MAFFLLLDDLTASNYKMINESNAQAGPHFQFDRKRRKLINPVWKNQEEWVTKEYIPYSHFRNMIAIKENSP